jgi:sensor histidine kinase regulating citrate/malate metabolism
MTMEDEVKQTYKILKDGGMNVVEIVFEGGFSVKNTDMLKLLQEMVNQGKAYGVVHVVYQTPEGAQRMIDIPTQEKEEVGNEEQEAVEK